MVPGEAKWNVSGTENVAKETEGISLNHAIIGKTLEKEEPHLPLGLGQGDCVCMCG